MRNGRMVIIELITEQVTQVYNQFIYPVNVMSHGLSTDIKNSEDVVKAALSELDDKLDEKEENGKQYVITAWSNHVAEYHS